MRSYSPVEVRYGDGVQLVPAKVEGGPLACDRCGTFAELSWSWDKRLCEECRERQHPALTTPLRVRRLLRESVALVPTVGFRGVLVALSPLPFALAVRLVLPRPDTGNERHDTLLDLGPSALLSAFSGISDAVLVTVLLQVLVQGMRPDYAAAWQQVMRRVAAVVVLAVTLSMLQSLGWATLKIVSATLAWAPFVLAVPILLNENVPPWTALRRSAFRLIGRYLSLLAAVSLLSLPMLLVIFAMVGVLSSLGAYNAEKNMLITVVSGCSELLALPLTALSAVLYVKLPPRMDVTG